ncbi:hypothetical protein IFO70_01110 [Phormidium tenue FACHB-886]|nr:hypothetical protein [Phormidium tenue FACHB-886]
MPNPEDVQPRSPSDAPETAELLDESSLNTVLDIVAAIETAEELALLETLTLAQKRQVWAAISDEQKLRLKQIRTASSNGTQAAVAPSEPAPMPALPLTRQTTEDPVAEPTAEADATAAEMDSLDVEEEMQADLQNDLEEIAQSTLDNPIPRVGDRVILLPKPQLNSADLIAIWDVIDIQGEHAQIKDKRLGTRRYPLNWLMRYPDPDF